MDTLHELRSVGGQAADPFFITRRDALSRMVCRPDAARVLRDVFPPCSAGDDPQVRAIVDEIEDRLRKAGAKPVRREGEREGRWVLLDYLDIVVHVQHAEERTFYGLERLWKDCPRIELPEPVSVAGPRGV